MNKSLFKLLSITCLVVLSQATVFAAVQEGQWKISPRAGVAPSGFNDRSVLKQTAFSSVNRTFVANSTTVRFVSNVAVSVTDSLDFKDIYNLPFVVGGDIGYVVMDNLELFVGLDYIYAGGDSKQTKIANIKFSSYSQVSGHVGGRFYIPLNDMFAVFMGAKIGVGYRKNSSFEMMLNSTKLLRDFRLFDGRYGVIGGPQAGFDVKVADNLSFKFMAEYLGMSNVRRNKKSVSSTPVANFTYKAQFVKGPRSSYHIPVTAGATITL
jgi:hypothetical protein